MSLPLAKTKTYTTGYVAPRSTPPDSETKQAAEEAQREKNVARNLLAVADNKDTDPVVRARAVKELSRFRGDYSVDAFFERIEDREKLRILRQRIQRIEQPIR